MFAEPITPQIVIQNGCKYSQDGNTINVTEIDDDKCTIFYDPIISSGIARFEGIFDVFSTSSQIGIYDSSVDFSEGVEDPFNDKYTGKNIQYDVYKGWLWHMQLPGIHGNANFSHGESVALEVNLDSCPRTIHFFVNGIYFLFPDQMFTLTRFERLSHPTSEKLVFEKAVIWGKDITAEEYEKLPPRKINYNEY
ncbi:MAG: hypothetical protein EZS28_021191 [Streblomastix strix]|uniref:B30.2/SPRY domain-containing protein n=1 Tax=Streblomastix strix TaxID=222440 RepID=A0A5J4VLZ2_9EUKA|nr:MAG: hypothetical protein EZS28_021191 [Streblomastix strix]